jgi:hypothetical protein
VYNYFIFRPENLKLFTYPTFSSDILILDLCACTRSTAHRDEVSDHGIVGPPPHRGIFQRCDDRHELRPDRGRAMLECAYVPDMSGVYSS